MKYDLSLPVVNFSSSVKVKKSWVVGHHLISSYTSTYLIKDKYIWSWIYNNIWEGTDFLRDSPGPP